MHKLFLLAAGAALLAAPTAHAQRRAAPRAGSRTSSGGGTLPLAFGLKAGANLANLSGDLANQSQYLNRWGFHGGVMLNIGLDSKSFLSIQPELLYSQKGFRYDEGFSVPGFAYRNTGSVRYDYLDVPVLLKIKTDGGVFFELGPQYSYLLNVKSERSRSYTTIGGGGLNTYNADTEDLSRVNRNEVGYAVGLGFQSRQGLLLGVRYNGAFNDLARDGYSGNDFRNARNSTFQGYVGVLLRSK